jgi:large subunit ribosomal protein L4
MSETTTVMESPSVPLYDQSGQPAGEVQLPAAVFGGPVHVAAMHQALVRQQANQRQGTAETKTRGEVSGGGKKPWRQKGTGRARQGSTRAPQWRHGGTVFGPHPRGYDQRMPRRQRRLALRAALADTTLRGGLRVVEQITVEEPKTRTMAELLTALQAGPQTLLVIPEHDLLLEKSTRNLRGVRTILVPNLNVEDVVGADTVVMTRAALQLLEEWLQR